MSASTNAHKKTAPHRLSFHVITVSTSKYLKSRDGAPSNDLSGKRITQLVREKGYTVAGRTLIPDNLAKIRKLVRTLVKKEDIDIIVVTGGTGITQSDVTIEAITPMLEKTLPGFGELFRRKSYERIGTAAILTRAVGGVIKGKAIFSIPGSPDSVEIALKEVILPESGHIIKHSREK